MTCTYTVRTIKCQFCTGKTHCAQCGAEVEEVLLRSPGVEDAALDLRQGRLRISGPDENALLDAIDDAGLLLG